jgi:two-component system, cell cycle sensor histidine kinase and response regulator CckA
MARAALERHGYKVVLADNGRQAIEMFEQDPEAFSLILLDLSMPGFSGVQTLPELRRARPDVPVLITSGYSEAQTLGMFAGQEVSGFLQKPFTAQVLLTKISDSLGK